LFLFSSYSREFLVNMWWNVPYLTWLRTMCLNLQQTVDSSSRQIDCQGAAIYKRKTSYLKRCVLFFFSIYRVSFSVLLRSSVIHGISTLMQSCFIFCLWISFLMASVVLLKHDYESIFILFSSHFLCQNSSRGCFSRLKRHPLPICSLC